MKKYYFRRHTFGGYAYTLQTKEGTFVSISFKTPLEAFTSLKSNL